MAKPGWPNGGWPSAGGPASEDFLVTARRIAAVRPVGWPHNLQASRGQGPSPVRARTTRRTAKLLACCVRRAPGDGQAAHGRPGQQRPIRPLAASLASSCPISSPWPAAAGGGSGRMSRPSGRRPSSCDQCGSTAATEPRRGRPQARWSTAMDGELGARGRAARAPGRSAGCRGARRRGTYWHTHRHSTCASLPGCCSPPAPVAAQVASRRAAATKEHSASGRKARQVRGGTACVCRVSACAHASCVSRVQSPVRTRSAWRSGAASLQ